jgi:hypothetical protein
MSFTTKFPAWAELYGLALDERGKRVVQFVVSGKHKRTGEKITCADCRRFKIRILWSHESLKRLESILEIMDKSPG